MRRARPAYWRIVSLYAGLAFLYVPIAWVIAYSFSGATTAGVWRGFSLKWYAALADNDALRLATMRSLLLAALAATLATALGLAAGYALSRHSHFRGRGSLGSLLAIPLFVPEILIGFSFLMLFVAIESVTGLAVGKGLLPLVVGHATLGMPVVASVVMARLAGLDRSYEEAAMDLGARPLRVFLTVTLPLMAPALASGWLLSFTLSFDDVITSSFVAGPAFATLPMYIYSSIRVGVSPVINVLGTLIIGGVATLVTLAMLASRDAAGPARGRL